MRARRLIDSLWVCGWILLRYTRLRSDGPRRRPARPDARQRRDGGRSSSHPDLQQPPDYRAARERVLEAAVRQGDGGGPLPRSTRRVRIGQARHDAPGRREPDRQRGRPRRLWPAAGRRRWVGRRDARAEGRGRRDPPPDRARGSGRAAHPRPPVAERRRSASGDGDLRRPSLAPAPGTRPRRPETDAHRRSPVREVPRRQRAPRRPAARFCCTTA